MEVDDIISYHPPHDHDVEAHRRVRPGAENFRLIERSPKVDFQRSLRLRQTRTPKAPTANKLSSALGGGSGT